MGTETTWCAYGLPELARRTFSTTRWALTSAVWPSLTSPDAGWTMQSPIANTWPDNDDAGDDNDPVGPSAGVGANLACRLSLTTMAPLWSRMPVFGSAYSVVGLNLPTRKSSRCESQAFRK